MNPLGTRGAADFANALDGGTAGTLPGVALAARLRTVGASLDGAVAPRPEFRDALRMRLMAVATVQAAALEAPVEAPAPLASAVSWRRRTGAVAAGAMASVVAVSGVAVAGSQSLPGDPFYGVKQTVEAFQLRTADGDLERGTQHLEFAATRLREVRGLTLGRDAADAGPQLGPSAMAGGITLRSASQPLAAGDALSAPIAERVKETLAAMDAQTREGTELLTDAYRSSRTPEPLRVLKRFATRQSAGLELLLPALPPRTQDRARISLALLDGVTEETVELLTTGTCAQGCDPTSAAPTLPTAPGTTGSTDQAEAPCDCAAPAPAPAPQPTAPATSEPEPQVSDEPRPEPTPEPSESASPSPSPSPSPGGLPLPLPPLPVPVPPLPVPVPTLTLAPVAPAVSAFTTGAGTVDSTSTRSGTDSTPVAPAPAPAPQPVPQLAPVPARP